MNDLKPEERVYLPTMTEVLVGMEHQNPDYEHLSVYQIGIQMPCGFCLPISVLCFAEAPSPEFLKEAIKEEYVRHSAEQYCNSPVLKEFGVFIKGNDFLNEAMIELRKCYAVPSRFIVAKLTKEEQSEVTKHFASGSIKADLETHYTNKSKGFGKTFGNRKWRTH